MNNFKPMGKDELDSLMERWKGDPRIIDILKILEATILELHTVIWTNKGFTQEEIKWAGENELRMAYDEIEKLKAAQEGKNNDGE